MHPYSALDFAPPSKTQGCATSDRWVTAVADGVIVRSNTDQGVMLDLDGDGDERTGWNVYYLHLASADRVQAGAVVKAGQPIGHPSCEGGSATGTHVHIARKYNGEWMPAGGISAAGILAYNFEGWLAFESGPAYEGYLKRNALVVWANTNANSRSFIQTDRR
jgi:murein DD-endopeptidase MepM/ murein hydrolase activator NlpD